MQTSGKLVDETKGKLTEEREKWPKQGPKGRHLNKKQQKQKDDW